MSHPKRLKIPILKFIDLGINHSPTHGIFDNVKVIGYVVLRYRIFEVILLVKTKFGYALRLTTSAILKKLLTSLFVRRPIAEKHKEEVMQPLECHGQSLFA